jgi:hypothetical protein
LASFEKIYRDTWSTKYKNNNKCVISGFCCGEYEISNFLGFYNNKPPIYSM